MINLAPNAPTHAHVGIGYKSQYLTNVSKENTDIGWLEIHAENYMIDGGPRKRMMLDLAEKYPISCHGVGLSVGSESGLNPEHLERLRHLIDWLKPALFSEHLAWSSHNAGYFNDLLPLPYTNEVCARVISHINQIQDTLGRQMLLENPSSYLAFDTSEMSEIDFIKKVSDATGCGLLLDINNVFISATNQNYDPYDYVNEYPLDRVGEIHLGGHDEDKDDEGDALLIDSHNAPVVDPVWALYEHTIAKAGIRPTLIEWDNDLPTWDVLANETRLAQDVIAKYKHIQHGEVQDAVA